MHSPTAPAVFTSPIDPGVDALWERRTELTPADGTARDLVVEAVDMLDAGHARVAFVDGATGQVVVDERARRAILLCFRLLEMRQTSAGVFHYHDRLPLKREFPGVRVVPGAVARWGSHHAPGTVLMPSYTNIGAFVDSGTMVDTWATVGSCAQIGKNVHLAGGVGVGGVLEPANAAPVVIEDDAFVGSRSVVVEGARVRRGAKLGAGVLLTASTRVFDAMTGEELPPGEAPEWSVCVGSTRRKSFPGGEFGVPCLLVIKRLPEGGRHDKLLLESLFREHGFAL
ncbi:2,3,4,5-tetrahydropyridine-2,6-dicarboxylate N-succinyltransferase [Streptomyces jumonjinensis]|uniref:2,3,4,5-tetrahydropyridine-2,6-dicarboxylate N-succinyltransferase n=1 Tax=Streptomyces jumonjinensis TaxID=1945 RepID=A0A646KKB3_STRJU|nr:2,3,4,5-tetrahydropyridine-2,6-dicarboxylate N-succinyltransferase [Streptomyces jumonjinensis]MQT02498.1 2,3,4,5-tetrahydropyridine-2,6-dicarboxylate N-succinyltransferase [Streptomyces jumonjinensis]